MKIEYDAQFDLLYIRFDDTEQQVINQKVNENIVLDIGKDNKIVGIEILGAKEVIDLKNVLPLDYVYYRKDKLEIA